MDFDEFMLLSVEQRNHLVWELGTFLIGKSKDEFTYNLYSVFSYYAEITVDKSKNCLEGMKIFKNPGFLDIYLDEITLPALDII